MEPVDFYGRGLPVEHLWLGFAADSTRMGRELDAVLSRASGTWVVLSRADDLDPAGRFARRMQQIATGGPEEYSGVRVWHVTRRPAGAQVPPGPR